MTQKIPVTRDGKRGSDVLLIDSASVLKIERLRDSRYAIHTKEHEYVLSFSLDSIEEWLYEDGFRQLDSNSIVNMQQVLHYDPRKGVTYLGSPADPKTKTASAARIHKAHIENVMSLLQESRSADQEGDEHEALDDDEAMRFTRSYATFRAMQARRQAEEKIVYMAYHDPMTGLPNRLFFEERLKEALAQRTFDEPLAVVFLDLDRFKVINDTLSHHAGDQLLQFVADQLSRRLPPSSVFARFGGDEFILLLPDVTDDEAVKRLATAIPEFLKEPFFFDKQELYVTASVGVSLYPGDGGDAETLIKNADVAMYKAKEQGGNTYELYHPQMNMRSLHRLNLESELRKAVERGDFLVYYQPLVELTEGRIFGMESLVRWKHPEWGMVSPGEFIPLAEETGLIVPLGNWVLREACRQNVHWQRLGLPHVCVSVNISVHQFVQSGFVAFIRQTLEETELAPPYLCLEITESVAMKNVGYIMDTISQLRQLGVRISIDDFGTGYSSLSYLKRFRVHTLKIDQSFIRDVTTDEDNAAIVTALIAMSQQLKIKSLAEGVETPDQLRFLQERGCDEIQGYIFSTPLPPERFELLLRENKNLYSCD